MVALDRPNQNETSYGTDLSDTVVVKGFVDTAKSNLKISGWAGEEGRNDILPIKIFFNDRLIGSGSTGERREFPPGEFGFTVDLVQPITRQDLMSVKFEALAVDRFGRSHRLNIWKGLFASPDEGEAQKARSLDALVASKVFEGGKPYVAGGEVFPPACNAADLRDAIANGDLRGFLKGFEVDFVIRCLSRDTLPIPSVANREGYCPNDDAAYWLSGFDDYSRILAHQRKGGDPHKYGRILDFGGSTGRVFRHFFTQGGADEVFACDFKSASVEWCKANFPPEIRVFLNTFYPGLPFPDGYFDLICGFSVFTHIDDFEEAWLLELSRILKPGGTICLTVQDESTWSRVGSNHPHLKAALGSPEAEGIDFGSPMPFDRRAFTFRSGSHYSCNVFHSNAYIRSHWTNYFEIVETIPYGYQNFQTVVIGRGRRPAKSCSRR